MKSICSNEEAFQKIIMGTKMAKGIDVGMVIVLLIYLIVFAAVSYWLISTNQWDFADYVQPDPSDTDQFYRINGNISVKPTVGTPCTVNADCTSGILLACQIDTGVCLSTIGGACTGDSDCIVPNSCIGNVCSDSGI